jgi:hypothetical protein
MNSEYDIQAFTFNHYDVNSGYLHTKQTEISQIQSRQMKIFKISYYNVSDVLKNEMIKNN